MRNLHPFWLQRFARPDWLSLYPQAGTLAPLDMFFRPTMPCCRIAIVIAAYNEGSSIGDVIFGILPEFPFVVVVDDGSLDNTAAVAEAAGATVLIYPINLGQGAALQTGIIYALRRGADYIVTFDGDGQHDPTDITPMIDALKTSSADIALGSRFLGRTVGMGKPKAALLKCAVAFTSLTTGLRLTDSHNGLRVLTRKAAQSINLLQNRMAHASEILEQIASNKLKYIEVPVTISYTKYSMSRGQRLSNSGNILIDLLIGRLVK